MPEGDPVHRTAAALRTALVGKPIERFEAPRLVGPSPAPGRVVERIESHGKHLEIVWDDGLTLHTHMRLTGAWHLYRSGERWRRPGRQMRVVIEVHDWVAVCFNAPVVETYRHFDRHRHPGFGPLGPDVSAPDADLDECTNRLYHYGDQRMPVCEVLLDQHVMCGVGNVYRSEVLWVCGVHPFAPISALDGDDCAAVVATAARLLRANLRAPSFTGPDERRELGVYGKNGQRCSTCGDTIEVVRTGEHARLLYWCPGCQVQHGPEPTVALEPEERPMDPHPAAAKYLAELPWRKQRPLAG